MSVSSIYDTILDLIRKDQHGKAFEIDEYNNVIELVNIEMYNMLAPKAGETMDVIDDLRDFKKINKVVPTTGTLSSGKGDLPSDYDRLLGKPWHVSDSVYYPIDVINSLEFADRMKDHLTAPTTTHPVCIFGDVDDSDNPQIQVYPTSITNIYINYLTVPTTPFLDYYVDANGTYTYMAEDAENVSIASGSTHRDGTAGPTTKDSSTVEFAWGSDKLSMIINLILQKAGIVLQSQAPVQYGMSRELKEQQ